MLQIRFGEYLEKQTYTIALGENESLASPQQMSKLLCSSLDHTIIWWNDCRRRLSQRNFIQVLMFGYLSCADRHISSWK